MALTNVLLLHFSFLLLVSTERRPQEANGCFHMTADSNLELEDETIKEGFDDDVLDFDFLLDLLDNDLTPTALGKYAQCIKTSVLEV